MSENFQNDPEWEFIKRVNERLFEPLINWSKMKIQYLNDDIGIDPEDWDLLQAVTEIIADESTPEMRARIIRTVARELAREQHMSLEVASEQVKRAFEEFDLEP